jgi:hypothetical protein
LTAEGGDLVGRRLFVVEEHRGEPDAAAAAVERRERDGREGHAAGVGAVLLDLGDDGLLERGVREVAAFRRPELEARPVGEDLRWGEAEEGAEAEGQVVLFALRQAVDQDLKHGTRRRTGREGGERVERERRGSQSKKKNVHKHSRKATNKGAKSKQ